MSEAPITVGQFCSDYFGIPVDDVSPDLTDPVVRFIRDEHGAEKSDSGVWMLDGDLQAVARDYLDVRSDGAIVDTSEEAADPWDEFIRWARLLYEHPRFDENERDYKIEVGEHVRSAQTAIKNDAEDWHSLLKRAFGPPNNLTYYITHSRFLDWARDEPEAAREAMLALWNEDEALDIRVQDFCDALPREIVTPGSRVELASFLLLADPTEYAMYRPSPIKKAAGLVEFPDFPDKPEAEIYSHALEFFDTLIREAEVRGLELRDRLDAQGLVWDVTKIKPGETGWDPEVIETFLRWRGDHPAIWWVNQGETYSLEMPAGLVTAGFTNKAGHVLQHHKNVSLLRKSDIIIHHAAGAVRALSQVTHKPSEKQRPWEPDGDVVRVARTKYFPLDDPIPIRGLDEDRRVAEPGPFDKYGGVKQAYLMPVTPSFSGWLRTEYAERWPEGSPWETKQRPTWLFQANPDVWDLAGHVAEMQIGDEDDFSVTRFKTELAIGDRVLLWQSGSEAGLYGIGQISGELFERAGDDDHFTASPDELAIRWRLTEKVDPSVLRSNLLTHPILKGLSVITSPQGSNFRVTDEQWTELRKAIDGAAPESAPPAARSLDEIAAYVAAQGLVISDRTLRRFHISLQTRGFVILSGLSGTGKTWLAEVYADAVEARHLLVPVAPNWTTNEDLLGYLNPIDNTYHDTAFSRFLRDAAAEYQAAVVEQRQPETFLLTLDEMNLARIEYYFAKFLSAMEVRMRRGTADLELSATERVQLTPNLLFVGTVNIDETTHGFADKVFDRAQLIELEAQREAIAAHIGKAAYAGVLLDVFDAVAEAKPFAFRVVDEIKAYVGESEGFDIEWPEAIDEQILQKVLPKLSGADSSIRFALEKLVNLADQRGLELTGQKAQRMLNDYDRDGFTSYF